jgi:hypothetical protein
MKLKPTTSTSICCLVLFPIGLHIPECFFLIHLITNMIYPVQFANHSCMQSAFKMSPRWGKDYNCESSGIFTVSF